jgi:CRP-like cAMP-binding protein
MDIKHFLTLQPGFENFSDAHLDVFARMMNVIIYPAKHSFTLRGEHGHAFYLIMNGAVAMSDGDALSGQDSDRLLRVGEWFGLLSLVENLPAFENCVATESVTVAAFNRVQFDDLFESAPPIGRHLLYMLAKQLARTLILQNNRLSARSARL